MMFLFDTLKISISSLGANKVRSGLSILGIVVGILTVASLLTLALGVRKEITRNIEGLGSNLVAVVPGNIDQGETINFAAQFGTSTLTEEDVEAIRISVPGARNVAVFTLLPGTVRAGAAKLDGALIAGSSPGFEKTLNISVARGRFVTNEDEAQLARVAVLGFSAATSLFGTQDVLGRTVEFRGESFLVVGVLEEVETALSFGPDQNMMVFLPIHTAWDIVRTKQIFRIMMQAEDAQYVDSLRDTVERVLLETHGGEKDFSVVTQERLVGLIGGIFDVLTAMLGAIAAISLLVGGIGIMNIMLVSVSERTKEIGIRKAVGATRNAILLQFLFESVMLTMGGAVVALVLFSAGILIVGPRSVIPLELDPAVLVLSLVFSIVAGLLSGIFPAYQASRKDPIAALRYE